MHTPHLKTIRRGAALFAASFFVVAASAPAHGPCDSCIEPDTARVDSKLRVDYLTFRAVWNPPRRVLTRGLPVDSNCYGCLLRHWRFHIEDAPTLELFTSRPPRPGFVFRAPDVPPGRYLVALFDGSEGGTHYTWDFVEVESGLPDEAADDALGPGAIAVAVGGGLLLAGLAALLLLRRRS